MFIHFIMEHFWIFLLNGTISGLGVASSRKFKNWQCESVFETISRFQNVRAWTVLISRNLGVGLAKTAKRQICFSSFTSWWQIRGSKELERHTALGEIMLNSDALWYWLMFATADTLLRQQARIPERISFPLQLQVSRQLMGNNGEVRGNRVPLRAVMYSRMTQYAHMPAKMNHAGNVHPPFGFLW